MRTQLISVAAILVAVMMVAGWNLRPVEAVAGIQMGRVSNSCVFRGKRLWGKVQVVRHFPDFKVQVVSHFPDVKVQRVNHFPDRCGKWQFVSHFPDFKIQYVSHFPDFKIQFVQHFPGVR